MISGVFKKKGQYTPHWNTDFLNVITIASNKFDDLIQIVRNSKNLLKKSTEYLSKILPLKNRGANYCVERYSVDFFLKIFWISHNLDQIIKFIWGDANKVQKACISVWCE